MTCMGVKNITCPDCGHDNEQFLSESVWYQAEKNDRLEEEKRLFICGRDDGEGVGCGRTLQFIYVPSKGEFLVESLPTHEAFINE